MDTWAIISNLSPKDVIVPLLGGLGGWLAALRMTRSNEKIANERRDDATDERVHDAKVSHDEDLTRRFKILMDGYERRIGDLTAEIHELRKRVEICERRWSERDARPAGP